MTTCHPARHHERNPNHPMNTQTDNLVTDQQRDHAAWRAAYVRPMVAVVTLIEQEDDGPVTRIDAVYGPFAGHVATRAAVGHIMALYGERVDAEDITFSTIHLDSWPVED